MTTFAKKLPTRWGKTEFVLSPIRMAGSYKCHVSAQGEDGEVLHFTMEQKGEFWRIVNAPLLPEWIMECEPYLSLEILEHGK
jgi:hypothetical protein